MRILLSFLVLATVSLPAVPAAAQLLPETNIQVQDFNVLRSTTQAGAHPRVDIRMRFCNDGQQITDMTNAGQPIRITTATPHGVTANNVLVRVLYVEGNTAANGVFRSRLVPLPGGGSSPNQLDLLSASGAPVIGNGDYTGGGELHVAQSAIPEQGNFGCTASATGDAGRAFVKDFTLQLPSGFLGNPTAVPQCPTHLWLAGSCPQTTQSGQVLLESVVGGTVILVPTSLFNLQTMGLEPARLGTEAIPAFPPGPFPNTATIRTTGDYGIDSSQINIPKELGATVGVVRSVNVVLCERAPCDESLRDLPQSVAPIEPARPFFLNPSSCGTKTARLEARSWNPGDAGAALETDLPTTGCDQVPFDPDVTVIPADNRAGVATSQRISIAYPEYEDTAIWQSALKDAEITLPDGMTVAPGAGLGLHSCSAAQFGIEGTTGKQLNNDPHRCPDASRIGSLEVTSPLLDSPLGGEVFFGPTSGPGRPTPSSPWRLFLLVEGAGLRLKLMGEMTMSEQGQIRFTFLSLPELPFTRLDLVTLGNEDAVLKNPSTCVPHQGAATLLGWSGKVRQSTPTVTPQGCTLSASHQGYVGSEERAGPGLSAPLGGALPPGSVASHTPLGPDGVSVDTATNRLLYIARDAEFNSITVTESDTSYVFTETGTTEAGGPIPPVDNPGGTCTVAAGVATCPKAGIDSLTVFGAAETGLLAVPHDSITIEANPPRGTTIDGGPGNDDILGGPGDDVILGREGIDVLDGRNGNDSITTGPSLEDPGFERFQSAAGGAGFDELRYDDRPGPVLLDFSVAPFGRDTDAGACPSSGGCSDILSPDLERLVGTNFNDEMIGGAFANTLVGKGGSDTLCGGLGVDTVDYSDSTQGVNVTLDGVLDTDPRHAFPVVSEEGRREYNKARSDCREIEEATGVPLPGGQRDCIPDDGAPGEGDCVGEDVENIIGSDFDDTLVGNSPDALEGLGPKVEPHGINDIEGRRGDDLIDGRFGPDALSGGDGVDTVTYASRVQPVSAAIDAAPHDGTVVGDLRIGDFDPRSKLSDSIQRDVENLVGGSNDDTLRGDSDSNVLRGNGGNDFVNGGEGNDDLAGDAGSDRLEGGAGADRLSGGADDDSLEGFTGDDQLQGDGGSDTADYSGAKVGVTVDLARADAQLTSGAGSDTISSTENLVGSPGNDILKGGEGSNSISSGAGDDQLTTRGGGTDLAACGQGIDAVVADTSDVVEPDCETLDRGEVNRPPDCSDATATPRALWPPNHKLRRVVVGGVTDPDGGNVSITITAVNQDEPVDGRGDGNTSPDARLGPSASEVYIRAERAGGGDGRVYRVSLHASDGKGGECSGRAFVKVRQSMRTGDVARDSGQSFDSLATAPLMRGKSK